MTTFAELMKLAGVLGIPSRSNYGDLGRLQAGQLLDWVVQHHLARRAGPHYDVRFGTPETGLYSWAARKGLPEPGQRHLAVQQPVHRHSYRNFEGSIPPGYGWGEVRKHDEGQVLVTRTGPGEVHFTTAHGRYPERYLLKQVEGKNWLLINTTKTEAVPHEKVHYAKVPAEKAEEVLGSLQPGSSVQAKIDGAASLTKLYKDHAEVVSYRAAKNTGHPIVHTERVFHGRPKISIPPELQGTVLRGELYGIDPRGRSIPPQALGGLLNSGVAKSIEDQRRRGVRLRQLLFDVDGLDQPADPAPLPADPRAGVRAPIPADHGRSPGPEDARGSYAQRLARVREVLKHLPADVFHGPEEATTPEAALDLWRRVKGGKHPLTHEGVVIHPPQGKPKKIKLTDEHDVHLREFFPGKGKYEGMGVGGFRYSHEPEGPIAGEVGTGFSDALRREMFANPAPYLGRVARVRAQEKLPSGALRAPALIGLHEDLPLAPSKEAGVRHPIEGTLDDAIESLTKRAEELRSRPPNLREKRAAPDFLTGLGQHLRDNPELSGALLGGGLGAATGGLGTLVGNRGKDETEKRSPLRSLLTGGLAGAALGGGLGMASRGWRGMSGGGAGGTDAMGPGEFMQDGQRMRIDPEALRRDPGLAQRLRELRAPPGPLQTAPLGALGAAGSLYHNTWSAPVLTALGLGDAALHNQGLRLGDRFGWGMIDPRNSRNVEHLRGGIQKILKSPGDFGLSNNQRDLLARLHGRGGTALHGLAANTARGFTGTVRPSNTPRGSSVPSRTTISPTEFGNLRQWGAQAAAEAAGKNKLWGTASSEPRVFRSLFGGDRHIAPSVLHPSRLAPRALLYGAIPAGELVFNALANQSNNDEELRRLVAANARPVPTR
jgi:hypothetical protein